MLQTLDGIRSPLDGFPSPLAARRGGGGFSTAAYAANSVEPELVADFASGFYAQDSAASTFGDLLTYTGASLKTMVDSDGVLKWAPHNLAIASQNMTDASWLVANGSGAGNPTRTANFATAPDGTTTATKIDFPAVSGGQFSVVRQQVAGAIGVLATNKIWMKAASASDIGKTIYLYGDGQAGQVGHVLTADWELVSASPSNTSPTAQIIFGALGASVSGVDQGACSALLWGAHAYRSDLGGMADNPDRGDSYVPTTSSAVYMGRAGHHKYNGSAWVNKGLLLESEARTNLITYSEDFADASWVKTSGSSVTANAAVSPDGTNSADKIIGASSDGDWNVQLGVTVGTATYAFSVFAKAAEFSDISLTQNLDGGFAQATFDLAAGTTNGAEGAYIEDWGDGWYRCVTIVNAVAGSRIIQVRCQETGDGSSGFFAWGVQLEEVSAAVPYASSYIPTSGATATRAAETLSIAAANMPSYTTAVSIAMAGEVSFADDGGTETVHFVSWGSAGDRIWTFYRTANARLFFDQASSGIFDDVRVDDYGPYDVGKDVAFSLAQRSGSTFVNGAADGVAYTANTTPTTLVDLSAINFEIATAFMGTIKRLVVWGADIGDTGIEEASA